MGAMTAVFVHGVPETPAVWHGLLAALDRPDTVALSLPGFDSARPAGFGATMEEYAGWLEAQLERLDGPVDLVGHDWGGGFVVRVVSTRPELVERAATWSGPSTGSTARSSHWGCPPVSRRACEGRRSGLAVRAVWHRGSGPTRFAGPGRQ